MILASCLEAKIFFNLRFADSDLLGVGGGGGGSHLGLEMSCLSSGRPLLCLWLLPTGSVPCTSRAYVCALGVFPMRPLFSKRPHNSDTWLRAPGSGTRGHADGPGVGNPRPLCMPGTSSLSFH